MSALQLVFVVFCIVVYGFAQAFFMMRMRQREHMTYAEALVESWLTISFGAVLLCICLGVIAVYYWLGGRT